MADHAYYSPYEEKYEKSLENPEGDEPRPSYSKAIVLLCFVTVIGYTVTCFVYMWNGKPLNDILTGFFFACFGLEFGSLAFIKGKKLKYVGGNAANKQMPHVELAEEEEEKEDGKVPQ